MGNFPSGTVDRKPPANTEGMDSIPGPRRFHTLQSKPKHHNDWTPVLQPLETVLPEKPPQGTAHTELRRAAPAHRRLEKAWGQLWRPEQPKMNKWIKTFSNIEDWNVVACKL